jgi:hypothetical protein
MGDYENTKKLLRALIFLFPGRGGVSCQISQTPLFLPPTDTCQIHEQKNAFLVKWKCELTGRAAELLCQEDLDELYANEPGLCGYFVRGAPAMLTENIQPTKFLVNGACGRMHSLTFSESVAAEVLENMNAEGYRLIELNEAPLSINFQLELPESDDGAGIESLVDDAIVVPVLRSKHSQEHDTASLFACQKAVPKSLRYRGHGVTLAFAVTDYKLQGKTKDELILSIAPRPFLPYLDLKGFYVDVSRVRKRSSLRVLHRPPRSAGGLNHLYDLHHTVELSAWNLGYDNRGDWSRSLAKSAAEQQAKQKMIKRRKAFTPQPKKQQAHCSGGARRLTSVIRELKTKKHRIEQISLVAKACAINVIVSNIYFKIGAGMETGINVIIHLI